MPDRLISTGSSAVEILTPTGLRILIPVYKDTRRDRRAEGGVEEPAIAGRRPGEAGDASRRKVIVGAVSHRVVVRRCGRRTNRGVITCRVMRVHFGVTMAEMHHEHSDTPNLMS